MIYSRLCPTVERFATRSPLSIELPTDTLLCSFCSLRQGRMSFATSSTTSGNEEATPSLRGEKTTETVSKGGTRSKMSPKERFDLGLEYLVAISGEMFNSVCTDLPGRVPQDAGSKNPSTEHYNRSTPSQSKSDRHHRSTRCPPSHSWKHRQRSGPTSSVRGTSARPSSTMHPRARVACIPSTHPDPASSSSRSSLMGRGGIQEHQPRAGTPAPHLGTTDWTGQSKRDETLSLRMRDA
ncbi:hypothetical protein BCR39DRAFT_537670 [Naematelia encephala]|uniref:Uncharacterized protein n=1 Tax=Naematelia encephala TaxID=71784 RepID=A0A1Y2AZC4_9TREE|nr:hypothetical protein BCR39DRAFT_537670 [Naematelia encephala]